MCSFTGPLEEYFSSDVFWQFSYFIEAIEAEKKSNLFFGMSDLGKYKQWFTHFYFPFQKVWWQKKKEKNLMNPANSLPC